MVTNPDQQDADTAGKYSLRVNQDGKYTSIYDIIDDINRIDRIIQTSMPHYPNTKPIYFISTLTRGEKQKNFVLHKLRSMNVSFQGCTCCTESWSELYGYRDRDTINTAVTWISGEISPKNARKVINYVKYFRTTILPKIPPEIRIHYGYTDPRPEEYRKTGNRNSGES